MFTKAKLHFVQMNKPLQTLHALCFAAALVGGTVASAERPPPIRVPAGVPKAPALKTGEFKAGTEFVKNQRYYSADGRYAMVFQADGNLVVYKFTDAAKSKFHPIWYSRTNGKAVEKCVFQTDGNLVLYDYTKKPVWDAWTDLKNRDQKKQSSYSFNGDKFYPFGGANSWLAMQNDGNLVIYAGPYPSLGASWAAGSFEKN